MTTKIINVIALAIFLVSGCGAPRRAVLPIADLPIVKEQVAKSDIKKKNNISVPDILFMDDAIFLALESNPKLLEFFTEIKIREARTIQESLLPNPELDVEIENFAGSGPMSGFKDVETTLSIGQLIELGGKRGKRTEIAALQSDLALWRCEMKRLEIITRVRNIFTQTLVMQKKLKLDRQILELARTFKSNIDTMVQAGLLSVAESARTQVELSNRKLILQQSIRNLKNSKRLLAATWGSKTVNFSKIKGDLSPLKAVPTAESLIQAMEKSPLLREQNVVIKYQKSEMELAKAQTFPDPVLSAGYRRFNETDDQAFVAGLTIPLPLFDRNQGGRQEARLRERRSKQHLQSLRVWLHTEINNQLEIIRSVSTEIETIQNIILPEAQKAYDIIRNNYRLGKYGLIDVLDAQRQLFDAERRSIEALAGINLQVIELEGLLGQSLKSL